MVAPKKLAIAEGDYIEIGNMGAYARAIAGHFNGYGEYDEVILLDAPTLTMYSVPAVDVAGSMM